MPMVQIFGVLTFIPTTPGDFKDSIIFISSFSDNKKIYSAAGHNMTTGLLTDFANSLLTETKNRLKWSSSLISNISLKFYLHGAAFHYFPEKRVK